MLLADFRGRPRGRFGELSTSEVTTERALLRMLEGGAPSASWAGELRSVDCDF